MHAPAPIKGAAALIGRQREVALLHEQLALVRTGRLQVTLLAGEPGIGKTRLLDAAATHALQHGAVVLHGGASEAEGMPPYLPFLEALGQHIRAASADTLCEQAGALAPILATILPELTTRLGELPPSYPLPADQARMRLYEAVGALLAAIATAHPLLLILDDLQWADAASLDLLCYVARHQPAARLLVLGAYREGEVEQYPAFGRAVAELNRFRVLNTITVTPLAEAEIATFATRYLAAPVDMKVSQLLFTQSEGNPFFAEELLRGWLETGAIVQTEGDHKDRPYTLVTSGAPTLPPSIVGAVRQRLARLPLKVVELLRTAAIIGRMFEVALLAEVVGQEVEAVEEQLLEAVQARLIYSSGVGAFTFNHDKIRECLYEQVTTIRRRRLHEVIGRALEARSEELSAHRLAELAFHFARSGDRTRGAKYAQQAAQQAMQSYAPEEAIIHCRAALSLIDITDQRRGAVLLALGEAALLANAYADAVTAFEAAQTWFTQMGDQVSAARAAHGLGKAWWQQEAIPQAQVAFETARTLLADRPLLETVQVLVDLSSLLTLSLHQQAEGLVYARQALELAQHLEEPRLIAAASRALGNLLARANDLSAGIGLLEHALDLAVAIDDPAEAAECCACLRMVCGWNGDFRRAMEYARHQIAFAQRCHDPYQLRHVYTHLAVFYMFKGQLSEAEQMLSLAQSALERLGTPEALAYLDWIKGSIAWVHGDYITAAQTIGGAIAAFRSINPNTVVWYLGMLAFVQAKAGKRQEARACMDELETLIAALPANSMSKAQALSWVVDTALILGDRERLFRLYPRLVPFRGKWLDRVIDRLMGEIETLQGNVAAARMSLAVAETVARCEDVKWELAHVLIAQANLELAHGGRGSATRARALLGEAQALFRHFGNQKEIRRLQERLRTLPPQPGARPLTSFPAGLSQREVEVLRLVATGKSNREIAEAFCLSEYTVAHHLTSIFNKMGVDNRAAATAFAFRHGLV